MHAFPVLFMMYEYFFIDSKVTAELNKREELQVELKNQKEEMKTTVRMFLNTPADINFDTVISLLPSIRQQCKIYVLTRETPTVNIIF